MEYKIKQETITKTCNFLNHFASMKIFDSSNIKKSSRDFRVNKGMFYYAVRFEYFKKLPNKKYECLISHFDPYHARVLIEYSYKFLYKKIVSAINDNKLFEIDLAHKIPPSINDVTDYCNQRKNNINPEKWYSHYESIGWKVGKNKMIDWKAAVRTWESYNSNYMKKLSDYSTDELLNELERRKYNFLLNCDNKILTQELKNRGFTGDIMRLEEIKL